ncbi:MAG: hypothetical protein Fur0022_18830 [Anaerolineales bacterium]
MVDSQWSGLKVKTLDPNARHQFGYGWWGFARLDAKGNSLQDFYQDYFSDRVQKGQPFMALPGLTGREPEILRVWGMYIPHTLKISALFPPKTGEPHL